MKAAGALKGLLLSKVDLEQARPLNGRGPYRDPSCSLSLDVCRWCGGVYLGPKVVPVLCSRLRRKSSTLPGALCKNRCPCNCRLLQTCCMRSGLLDSLLHVGTSQGAAVLHLPAKFIVSYLQHTICAHVGSLPCRLLATEQGRSVARKRAAASASRSNSPSAGRSSRAKSAPLRSTLRKSIEEDAQRPLHVKLQEDAEQSQHVHVLLQQADGSWFPNPDSDHEGSAQGNLLQKRNNQGVRSSLKPPEQALRGNQHAVRQGLSQMHQLVPHARCTWICVAEVTL